MNILEFPCNKFLLFLSELDNKDLRKLYEYYTTDITEQSLKYLYRILIVYKRLQWKPREL